MATCGFILLHILYVAGIVCSLDTCVHDLLPKPARTNPSAASFSGDGQLQDAPVRRTRTPRQAVSGPFEPLRIYHEYHDVARELTDAEQGLLDSILTEAVLKVQGFLSVSPVVGPLLLRRAESACLSRWTSGPNAGRCGQLSRGYNGETCLDGFRVPEDHLEGLYIWNATHPDPVVVRPPGSGVPNTDYVLYVQASTTDICYERGQTVMAYATYCQQDELGRPVAGLINYCPARLRASANNRQKIFLTSLHELFHALGFSKELWEDFRDCSQQDPQGHCPEYRHPTRFVHDRTRLITPRVMQLAQSYYNCSLSLGEEFGPALEETETGGAGSHWDPVMMRGSIMMAELGEVSVTRVDPFTLTALADSGWYEVNMNAAQDLVWGKSGGCQFGLPESCNGRSPYFCSQGCMGCHTLHRHKGTCELLDGHAPCAVVQATEQGSCENPANQGDSTSSLERFGASSRCFLSNLTSLTDPDMMTLVGSCLPHRCQDGELEVQLGDLWCPCPYGTQILVPGMSGVLQCPSEGILCTASQTVSTEGPSSTHPVSTSSTAAEMSASVVTTTPAGLVRDLSVELVFLQMSYPKLIDCGQLDNFQDQVKTNILALGRLRPTQLCNITVCDGSVRVMFTLHAYSQSDVDVMSAYGRLQNSVKGGNFIVYLPENTTYSASVIRLAGDDTHQTAAGCSSETCGWTLKVVLSLGLLVVIHRL